MDGCKFVKNYYRGVDGGTPRAGNRGHFLCTPLAPPTAYVASRCSARRSRAPGNSPNVLPYCFPTASLGVWGVRGGLGPWGLGPRAEGAWARDKDWGPSTLGFGPCNAFARPGASDVPAIMGATASVGARQRCKQGRSLLGRQCLRAGAATIKGGGTGAKWCGGGILASPRARLGHALPSSAPLVRSAALVAVENFL